jgi:thymidylate synthase ThyX
MNDMADIRRFVTNETERVFLLRNLPEEVVATTMALYSRQPGGLRENLRKMVERGDVVVHAGLGEIDDDAARARSRAFQTKWIVGYGHSSVSEHAWTHFGAERISFLAAKAIERHRLAAYTEKSTRFVRMERAALVERVGFEGAAQAHYLASADALFGAYGSMLDEILGRLAREHPEIDEKSRNGRACDLLRGLLPAGTGTNVGVSVGAREFAHMIRTLSESPLPENNGLSDELRREGMIELPVLLRHLEPSRHRAGASARVAEVLRRIEAAPGALIDDDPALHWFAGDERPRGHDVELLDHHAIDARSVATAILRECRDARSMKRGGRAALSESQAAEVIDAYLADRGEWDAVCRAMEHSLVTFRITCDAGAWRDLQRHRMKSQTEPLLSPRVGFACPAGLAEFGMEGRFCDAMHAAAKAYERIEDEAGPLIGQYAVPLGFHVTWCETMNLRSLFQGAELRSTSAGHPSYRAVAIDMGDAAIAAAPWIARHLRLDRGGYVWAREPKHALANAAALA